MRTLVGNSLVNGLTLDSAAFVNCDPQDILNSWKSELKKT